MGRPRRASAAPPRARACRGGGSVPPATRGRTPGSRPSSTAAGRRGPARLVVLGAAGQVGRELDDGGRLAGARRAEDEQAVAAHAAGAGEHVGDRRLGRERSRPRGRGEDPVGRAAGEIRDELERECDAGTRRRASDRGTRCSSPHAVEELAAFGGAAGAGTGAVLETTGAAVSARPLAHPPAPAPPRRATRRPWAADRAGAWRARARSRCPASVAARPAPPTVAVAAARGARAARPPTGPPGTAGAVSGTHRASRRARRCRCSGRAAPGLFRGLYSGVPTPSRWVTDGPPGLGDAEVGQVEMPSAVTRTLAGLMSRWITPRRARRRAPRRSADQLERLRGGSGRVDQIAAACAADQLHHDVRALRAVPDLVHRHNVRCGSLPRDGLALEARLNDGSPRAAGRSSSSPPCAQRRLPGLVDDAHPTVAELALHHVTAHPRSSGQHTAEPNPTGPTAERGSGNRREHHQAAPDGLAGELGPFLVLRQVGDAEEEANRSCMWVLTVSTPHDQLVGDRPVGGRDREAVGRIGAAERVEHSHLGRAEYQLGPGQRAQRGVRSPAGADPRYADRGTGQTWITSP